MLDEQPILDVAALLCLDAWQTLETCRALGYGVLGPIPYTAILAWAREHRLDPEARMILVDTIRTLDRDRMERASNKNRTETAP